MQVLGCPACTDWCYVGESSYAVPCWLQASRIIRRARQAREGGPWLAFRDDQLTTYWYHLHDKVVTYDNPYFGASSEARVHMASETGLPQWPRLMVLESLTLAGQRFVALDTNHEVVIIVAGQILEDACFLRDGVL